MLSSFATTSTGNFGYSDTIADLHSVDDIVARGVEERKEGESLDNNSLAAMRKPKDSANHLPTSIWTSVNMRPLLMPQHIRLEVEGKVITEVLGESGQCDARIHHLLRHDAPKEVCDALQLERHLVSTHILFLHESG